MALTGDPYGWNSLVSPRAASPLPCTRGYDAALNVAKQVVPTLALPQHLNPTPIRNRFFTPALVVTEEPM